MSYIKPTISYSSFYNGYENLSIANCITSTTNKKPYKFNSAEKSLKKLFEIVVLKNNNDVSNEFEGAESIYEKFSIKANQAISEQIDILNSGKSNKFYKFIAHLTKKKIEKKLEQIEKYYIPLKYLKGENLSENEKLRLESFKKELSFKKKVLQIARIGTLILIGVGAVSLVFSLAMGNMCGIFISGALMFSPMIINLDIQERLNLVRSAIKILNQTKNFVS